MQLSKKQEILAEFFSSVLKSRSNFEHFEQKVTIIGYIIPKVQTAKDVVRLVSQKARFRRPFDKQHIKLSQKVSKSSQQHL